MDQQTVTAVVAVLSLCVAMATMLYGFARNVKNDLSKDIETTHEQLDKRIEQIRVDAKSENETTREWIEQVRADAKSDNEATRQLLDERIEQIRADAKSDNEATRPQLGDRIEQIRAEHAEFREQVRANFAAIRGSLDTLERRTFDIATGSAEA